jgi:hypothetical protein
MAAGIRYFELDFQPPGGRIHHIAGRNVDTVDIHRYKVYCRFGRTAVNRAIGNIRSAGLGWGIQHWIDDPIVEGQYAVVFILRTAQVQYFFIYEPVRGSFS